MRCQACTGLANEQSKWHVIHVLVACTCGQVLHTLHRLTLLVPCALSQQKHRLTIVIMIDSCWTLQAPRFQASMLAGHCVCLPAQLIKQPHPDVAHPPKQDEEEGTVIKHFTFSSLPLMRKLTQHEKSASTHMRQRALWEQASTLQTWST
jgi:hypothetical protein